MDHSATHTHTYQHVAVLLLMDVGMCSTTQQCTQSGDPHAPCTENIPTNLPGKLYTNTCAGSNIRHTTHAF
jgi:hypothetical protein